MIMSYNEIAETFSEYSKGKSSNCQHLIELFQQAMIQMEEEEQLLVVEPVSYTHLTLPTKA